MNYQYQYHYNSNAFTYVKKEDAKQLLGKRRYLGGIFAIILATLFAVFEFVVFPELEQIKIISRVELPFYSLPNFRYTVYTTILALLIFVQPEPPEELDRKLAKYKDGEMILASKLMDKGYNTKIGLIFFFAVAYFVLATVLPIAYITEGV